MAPAALRDSGLLDRLRIPDSGDAHPPHSPGVRDRRSGILAHEQVLQSNRSIRDAVAAVYEQHCRPLVLGGDCGCLIGAVAAAADRFGTIALVLADGHADYWDGHTSETGELADMSTAVINGWGPPDLIGLAATSPMVHPKHTVLLGYRDDPDIAAGQEQELDRVPADTQIITGVQLRDSNTAVLVQELTSHLVTETSGVWLHIDVDVLDEAVMPAVTYPKSGGPDFDQLTDALRPVVRSPGLIGISVADLRPDLDSDATFTNRTRDLLVDLLTDESPLP
jgi:arginase